jgi:hypothetical protein
VALPKKTINSVRYARLASRGALTRLALYFNSANNQEFTGCEVAAILLRVIEGIGSPDGIQGSGLDAAAEEKRIAEATA